MAGGLCHSAVVKPQNPLRGCLSASVDSEVCSWGTQLGCFVFPFVEAQEEISLAL